MFGVSMWELVIVGLVLFLVVGPTKLPELAKKLGSALGGLRRSVADFKKEVDIGEELSIIKDVRNLAMQDLNVNNLEDEPIAPESVPMPGGPSTVSLLAAGRKKISSGKVDSPKTEPPGKKTSEKSSDPTSHADSPTEPKRPARHMIKPGKAD